MISEKKNILLTDFEEKKSLQGNTWGKNYYNTKKNISFMVYNVGKNHTCLYAREIKKFYIPPEA